MNYMKFLSLLLVFGALLSFSSCTKDNDTANPDNSDVYLTCKIDGTTFSAEPLTVGGTSSGNNFTVQGNGSGLDALSVSMILNSSYKGVGTYGFGENYLSNTALYMPKAINPAEAFSAVFAGNNAGQIEITLDDGTYVEGTFHFICANQNNTSQTASITEGKFRAKLP